MAANSTSNTVTAVVTVDTSQIRQGMADAKKQIGDATKDIAASSTVTLKQPTLGDDFAKQVAGRMADMRNKLENDVKRRAIFQASVEGLRAQGMTVPATAQEKARISNDIAVQGFIRRAAAMDAERESRRIRAAASVDAKMGRGPVDSEEVYISAAARDAAAKIKSAGGSAGPIMRAASVVALIRMAGDIASYEGSGQLSYAQNLRGLNLPFMLAQNHPGLSRIAGAMGGLDKAQQGWSSIPLIGNAAGELLGGGRMDLFGGGTPTQMRMQQLGLEKQAESVKFMETLARTAKIDSASITSPLEGLRLKHVMERDVSMAQIDQLRDERNGLMGAKWGTSGYDRRLELDKQIQSGSGAMGDQLFSQNQQQALAKQQFYAGMPDSLTFNAAKAKTRENLANLKGNAVEAFTQGIIADASALEKSIRVSTGQFLPGTEQRSAAEQQAELDRALFASGVRVQAKAFAASAPMAQGFNIRQAGELGARNAERQRLQDEFEGPFGKAMKAAGLDGLARFFTLN